MRMLAEIEAAAKLLPPEQKQELILFQASRLRTDGVQPPAPRGFAMEEIAAWIAEDEADLRRFQKDS